MLSERSEGREQSRFPIPLHNIADNGGRPHQSEESSGASSGVQINNDGTWGERDVGGPVNLRHAMIEYEDMRRELTNLSKTRSAGTTRPRSSALKKTRTSGSQATRATRPEPDVEAQGEDKEETEEQDDDEDEFELGDFLKDGHFEKRQEGRSAKKVGLVYKNLTVKGVGATTAFVRTLPSAIVGVSFLGSRRSS